jgi:hypothetical protein
MANIVAGGSERPGKFRRFMGGVAMAVSAPIALASGLVAATAKSIEKGSFDEFESKLDEIGGNVMQTAKEIGEEHGPELLVTVTAIVIGGKINGNGKK